MHQTSRFACAAALATALSSSAQAEVTFPQSETELIAWANDDAYMTDLAHRRVVWSAMFRAMDIEGGAGGPYTTAIEGWFQNLLASDARHNQMYLSVYTETATTEPLDVYLLLGGSNMAGKTQSGLWNGPDPEIQAGLAHAPGRKVMTINCALPNSYMTWWLPSRVSFNYFDGSLRHNPLRECIEYVSLLRDQMNKKARVRGVFFYQGELTVTLATGYHTSTPVDNWLGHYQEMLDFLRNEYGQIPAVHATLATTDSTDPEYLGYWAALRQVQRDAVTELTDAAVVDTTAISPPLTLADGTHLDDDSQQRLGQELAAAMNVLRAQGGVQ